jgi:hypothetical protein
MAACFLISRQLNLATLDAENKQPSNTKKLKKKLKVEKEFVG